MQHAAKRPSLLPPRGVVPLAALLAALLLCAAPPALADDERLEDHERAKALLDAGEIMPLEEVLRIAMRVHPGQPLEVILKREEEHTGYIYEIQMLDADGRVWELELDAATGEVVHTQPED